MPDLVCAVTIDETALPNSASKFCVVILVSDSASIGGIDDDDAEDGILVIGSVQLEGDAAEGLSVHLDLLAALRIFICGVAPAELLRAGQQQLQVGEVTIADGQILDFLLA